MSATTSLRYRPAYPCSDKHVAACRCELRFTLEPTGVCDDGGVPEQHIAKMEAVFDRRCHPPNRHVDDLVRALVAEGVGWDRQDDADRDLIHPA